MKKITLIPMLLAGLTLTATAVEPTAPINAGAYNFTDTTARISFKDMSMNEDGFRIKNVDAANAVLTTHTPADTNLSNHYEYVNLTGLTADKLYTVDIVAFNADGESTSLRKSFRTLETPQTPAQPTNIGAYAFTNSSARISLLDNAHNELGFKIYNNGIEIGSASPKAGTGEHVYINLTGLNTCSLYTVDVVAFNANGESEASEKSFMTTGCMTATDIPLAPSNVGVYNITDQSVRVSFLDNANNEQIIDGFAIYSMDDNNTPIATLPRDRYDHEYQYVNLEGLTPNTLYTIRVAAENGVGVGSAELKSFHTLP
jgi:hypothetical protein